MLTWASGRPTQDGGAFAVVAVDASRSTHGNAFLAVNVDEPTIAPVAPLGSRVETIVATAGFYAGWNDCGIAISLRLLSSRTRSATRLGVRLLDGCKRLNQLGDRVASIRRIDMLVVAVDVEDVRAWRCRRHTLRSLSPCDGLLLAAGGHTSADPLPGGGWTIAKLDRLHRRLQINRQDVVSSLADARLGDSTTCAIVVEPANRRVHVIHDRRTESLDGLALRRSA